MFDAKESFWKKKGFYISACTLLLAIMAVGAIYYRNTDTGSNNKIMADIATEVPDSVAEITVTPSPENESAQTNANVSQNVLPTEKATDSSTKVAGKSSVKKKATQKAELPTETPTAKKTKAVSATAKQIKHSFDEESGLLWPVKGDVILKYSMNNTVYFKTLAQYKCNPGIVISAKKGTNVKAAADGCITKIEKDDELGTVVSMDIGDNYTLSYGQLDNISVNKGDEIKAGDVIGTIAKPTKYYSEEGSNLYFQVKAGKETVDPLLLLK